MDGKEQIVVTAAIIEKEGEYLISKRPVGKYYAGRWEFPGGVVEFGEDPRDCVRREIKEELNVEIKAGEIFDISSFVYGETKHVILLGYLCRIISGETKKGVECVWVTPAEMANYDFCEADIVFVKKLQQKIK